MPHGNDSPRRRVYSMLAGLLKPGRGTAIVAGFDVLEDTLEVKRRIGYLAENPYLYTKLTGREFLAFMGDLYSVEPNVAAERAERLLALFELQDRADELVESYSHGMRQKLALAGSLLHEPQVLFLDEPTSGLDPRSARVVKDLLAGLAERGRTVFLSTHILEIAQHMCHRVGIIDRGELVAVGTLEELRRQARAGQASLEEIFLQLTGGAEVREVAASLFLLANVGLFAWLVLDSPGTLPLGLLAGRTIGLELGAGVVVPVAVIAVVAWFGANALESWEGS